MREGEHLRLPGSKPEASDRRSRVLGSRQASLRSMWPWLVCVRAAPKGIPVLDILTVAPTFGPLLHFLDPTASAIWSSPNLAAYNRHGYVTAAPQCSNIDFATSPSNNSHVRKITPIDEDRGK